MGIALSLDYIRQAVAHRRTAEGLLNVFLRLFCGHDIPAVYWAHGRRPGYYKTLRLNRYLAFEAHLLGAVLVGSYPFRGVRPGCGCEARAHVCDGGGCKYLCVDIDAKNNQQDTDARTRRLMGVCWRAGLLPVVFASRSGNGAHVYLFLDGTITTREAHAAGKVLAEAAGISERRDIIPSGEHHAGLGTLHALPLSPMASPGGGVMFDSLLRPVPDSRTVVSLLQWADTNRSDASIVQRIAGGDLALTPHPAAMVMPIPARVRARYNRENAEPSKHDGVILKAMRASHPQFRKTLSTPASLWRGKRSSRDAYLVSYMRRQGMSPAGIVAAMVDLPGTKAASRGPSYTWSILDGQLLAVPTKVLLAGMPLGPQAAKAMRQDAPWCPWDARHAPPRQYGDRPSPWWRDDVQERLRSARSGVDGIVLAHLVDRYYRGPVRQRMFYASQRGLARQLRLNARTVGRAVRRVAKRFPGVLRVVPGVSHPILRIANGYYVPERQHRDRVDWYVGSMGAERLVPAL